MYDFISTYTRYNFEALELEVQSFDHVFIFPNSKDHFFSSLSLYLLC
jgi:hypothetical protein